jgi:hypothetical protein
MKMVQLTVIKVADRASQASTLGWRSTLIT